jgi:hypothetical protein
VALEELLVVGDDPVVDPDHRAVADGVVVGLDRRMALRVVAHVDERLGRVEGNPDAVEQLARARALLVDAGSAPAAVRIADGVRAALGDPREQGLGCERPVDARGLAQAIAGDAAHQGSSLGPRPVDTGSCRRIGSSRS